MYVYMVQISVYRSHHRYMKIGFLTKATGQGFFYEICIRIESGKEVWGHGPFACRTHSDLKMFRKRMKNALDEGEMVIVDKGYYDQKFINPNNES